MNAATMTISTRDDGSRYLSGVLSYALERGAILILRKRNETEYELVAASGDGRRVSTDPQTLFSFCEPTPQEELEMASCLARRAR